MTELRAAYEGLHNDDERRGFLEAALHHLEDAGDGAFVGALTEILGEDWPDELERLGLMTDTESQAQQRTQPASDECVSCGEGRMGELENSGRGPLCFECRRERSALRVEGPEKEQEQ